ncbi:amidohydrolase [Actinomycetospora sp. TBRC 11914]|uniref:amidohydrolase n=1 Tax=Actinomycetospora sp. TBRC 11914 TaxID=2729387 RepID=UPI00145D305A|nr:amidohydrolase [Actinomycetospora sp. TBRC 11914]NMO93741.1 M20 family metallo-hydrolase [Actinomycetospora sp. TBRC 11914]
MSTAVTWRRDLHAHPEVGFTEFRTASRAAGRLADLGWDIRTGTDAIDPAARLGPPDDDVLEAAFTAAAGDGSWAGDERFLGAMRGGLTAVVATLDTGRPGRHVALRADTDALPITESAEPGHPPTAAGFRSTREGAMHACGHDGHVGMAVELAERLTAAPPDGRVTILFQPAEEGGRGAAAMVPAGVVDDVDVLLAAHLGIGLHSGAVAAAVDGLLANTKYRATFHGRAAHAAMAPHEGRSALLAAAAATLAVHTAPPFPGHETRVAVGALHGGTVSNIVPDRATVLLETRADDGAVNDEVGSRVRAALEGAAATYGCTVDVEPIGSVTTATGDPSVSEAVARAAREGGVDVVVPTADLGVASDDATAFMRRVQSHGGVATYLAIGSDLAGPHHTPGFDVDEAVLGPGVDLLERAVRALTAR